jgi:hypothetical protein
MAMWRPSFGKKLEPNGKKWMCERCPKTPLPHFNIFYCLYLPIPAAVLKDSNWAELVKNKGYGDILNS